jgi:lipoate-protein ligase A
VLTIRRYDRDDGLIEAVLADRRGRWRVWVPDKAAVVLGLGSRVERELNVDACLADGVQILKRDGGGCAVVIEPGQVIVSVVLPTEGLHDNRRYFGQLTEWVIGRLKVTGIEGVAKAGTSDLAVGDRKVGGACIHRTKDYLYYTTTLLVDPLVELMERYLKHPPREPEYRRGRGHRDFVMGLEEVEKGLTAGELKRRMTNITSQIKL